MPIKLCPFCGNKAEYKYNYFNRRHWEITCTNPECGIKTPPKSYQKECKKIWNFRIIDWNPEEI